MSAATAVISAFLESPQGRRLTSTTQAQLRQAALELIDVSASYSRKAGALRIDQAAKWATSKQSFQEATARVTGRITSESAWSSDVAPELAGAVRDAFAVFRARNKSENDPASLHSAMAETEESHARDVARAMYNTAVDIAKEELEAVAARDATAAAGEDLPWAVRMLAANTAAGDDDADADRVSRAAVLRDAEADESAVCGSCNAIIAVGITFGRNALRYQCLECRSAETGKSSFLCPTCFDAGSAIYKSLHDRHTCPPAEDVAHIEGALRDACPHLVSHHDNAASKSLGATKNGCWLIPQTAMEKVMRHKTTSGRANDSHAKRTIRAFEQYGNRPCLGLVNTAATSVEWLTYEELKPRVASVAASLAPLCRALEVDSATTDAHEPVKRTPIGLYTRSNSATYLMTLASCFVSQGLPVGCDGKWAHADACAALAAASAPILVLDVDAAAAFIDGDVDSDVMAALCTSLRHIVVIRPILRADDNATPTTDLQRLSAIFPDATTVQLCDTDGVEDSTCEVEWPEVNHTDSRTTVLVGKMTSGTSGGKARKGVWRDFADVDDDIAIGAKFPSPLVAYLYYSPSWSTGFAIAFTNIFHGSRLAVPADSQHPPAPWDGICLIRPTAFLSTVPALMQDLMSRYDGAVSRNYHREQQEQEQPTAIGESRARGRAMAMAADELYTECLGGRAQALGCGGAIVSVDTMTRLEEMLPLTVIHGYGATEGGAIGRASETRPGWLRPATGVSTKLEALPDLGYTLDDRPYPRGELLVRTPFLAKKDRWLGCTSTHIDAKYDEDGYYRTGDVVEWDSATREFRIIDRASASVKLPSGAFFVPSRIECIVSNVVADLPSSGDDVVPSGASGPTALIVDQRVVALYTVPSTTTDAKPGSFVLSSKITAKLTSAVRAAGRAAGLSSAEIPEVVTAVAVSSAAMTPSMKLLRTVVISEVRSSLEDHFSTVVTDDDGNGASVGASESYETKVQRLACTLLQQMGLGDVAVDSPLRDVGLDSTLASRAMVLLQRRRNANSHTGVARPLPAVQELPEWTATDIARTLVPPATSDLLPPGSSSSAAAAAISTTVIAADADVDEAAVMATRQPSDVLAIPTVAADEGASMSRQATSVSASASNAGGGDEQTDDTIRRLQVQAFDAIAVCAAAVGIDIDAPPSGSLTKFEAAPMSIFCNTANKSETVLAPAPYARLLVTGATGFLGRNLLRQLVVSTDAALVSAKLVCPVRAMSDDHAITRIVDALTTADPGLASQAADIVRRRIVAVPCDLAMPDVAALATTLHRHGPYDSVFHCAAKVRSWPATRANVDDLFTHNALPCVALICVAAASGGCPVVYASTGSVIEQGVVDDTAVEDDVDRLAGEHYDLFTTYNAYGITKLLGEAILVHAVRNPLAPWFAQRGGRVEGEAVCLSRLPLLTPTESDRNPDDWLHRLLSSCATLGIVPSGGFIDAHQYVCVRAAADALIVRLAVMSRKGGDAVACPIVHLHATRSIRVSMLLRWIADEERRFGARVNVAAFRYTLMHHERPESKAVASAAAAFLPLISQLPQGGAAAISTLMVEKLATLDGSTPDQRRENHRDFLDSCVVYVRQKAALPPPVKL